MESIHVRALGDEEPTLIFVHGLGCSSDDWAHQLSDLSRNFRCIAVDLPGHGISATAHMTTVEAFAEAVNFAKGKSGGREFILIGHSLGAKIIRECYYQSNDGIRGLVFVDGSINQGPLDVLIKRAENAIDQVGFREFAKQMFGEMFVDGSDRRLKERIVARAEQIDPLFGRHLWLDSMRWDVTFGRQSLEKLDVPVLVLQSTDFVAGKARVPLRPDMTTPFMDMVSQLVPQSKNVIVPAGHFTMMEKPDTVNRCIREFVWGTTRL